MKVLFGTAAGILMLSFFVSSSLAPRVVVVMGLASILMVHYRASRLLRKRVDKRSHDLRRLGFADLEEMVDAEAAHAEYTTTGSIDVLVSRSDPDTLLVVVRGSADVLFYSLLRVDGFHAARDGRVWPMTRPQYCAVE